MTYVTGFLIWLAIGLLAGVVIRLTYRAETLATLTLIFGVFGAFVGGMLGVSPYIYHDPSPVRLGGLIGAAAGAFFFAWLYHVIQRKFA